MPVSYTQVWMGSGHVWVAVLNGAECSCWDASVVILNVSLSQPGPQQGGSRCHHNLTVCWPSHDRAISGPGLPTCCQFHWSQSSQIINNVPAPHLHRRLTHSIHLTLALCCFMDFFGRCYGLKIVSMCKKFLCPRCELRNQTRLIMCAVVCVTVLFQM